MLRCPKCGSRLESGSGGEFHCRCGAVYPQLSSGGIDFLQGAEFADFELDEHDPVQFALLEQESAGVAARMEHFVLPLIRRYFLTSGKSNSELAVLDCGCGNGLSVDILKSYGFDAWGLDAGRARHQQWCKRQGHSSLLSANALQIPFEDAAFDVVLSLGLVEHIGIHEDEVGGYRARRLADCHAQRQSFVLELVRVLRPDGFILPDHPNGSFPADFWHGGGAGSIRWHWPKGDMLPRFNEIASYLRHADATLRLISLSPNRRLSFSKVGAHWYGRVFALLMRAWLRLMEVRGLSFLARTFMNPYLVTVATRRPERCGLGKPY